MSCFLRFANISLYYPAVERSKPRPTHQNRAFLGEARLRTKRQLKAQSALIMSFVRCKKNKAYVSVKIGII